MKNNKNKKNKVKMPISVSDLQTWLDGYCSAHGEDWSPTPEQWAMIKNKIFSLRESTVEQTNGGQRSVIQTPAHNREYSTITPQYQVLTQPHQQPPSGMVGLTDTPPMIMNGSALKTPDKDRINGVSDFA